ncbi:MAG: LacI family transcriptional regulator [Clostridiales bacterium]|nr:LacI family transcriptional regulator [Clostridiales bacterium]
MAVTIKDVARETNLAISTISKYMNGGTVRLENKERIEAAIQKLGYVPNDAARGLRTSRTYMVGVVMGTIDSPHTAGILAEIESRMRSLGYALNYVSHEQNLNQTEKGIRYLLEKGVDGILVTPMDDGGDLSRQFHYQNVPAVVVEKYGNKADLDYVQVDNCGGAYEIVEHLVKNGHRRIAIVKGPDYDITARERLQGYLRVFEDYGYEICPEYMVEGSFNYRSGYEGIQKLWKLPERPTAVFITNYDECLGAMAAVYNLGIRVPEELSVVSFDDFAYSVMVRPKLTVVRQPLKELADEACDLLLRRMKGDYSDFPRRVRLKSTCIYRDSVQAYKP